jgi:hypothetical protein
LSSVQVRNLTSATSSGRTQCTRLSTSGEPKRFECQTASNRDPGSAWKRDPSPALGQACPGSEQEGPARVAQCPHERRSGARGRCLFAHRGQAGVALTRGV